MQTLTLQLPRRLEETMPTMILREKGRFTPTGEGVTRWEPRYVSALPRFFRGKVFVTMYPPCERTARNGNRGVGQRGVRFT